MALQPGANLGQYQIQQVIGSGGMATVYKAHHTRLDRTVAVKVMHPQYLADEQFQTRFEREARVIAKLDHPNIVSVYDYDEYEHQPYLVIKYIEGRTLKQAIRQGAIPLPEILRIMNAVAQALDYAHQQRVLHRDVKPSNIILADDGTPYVTDFGLARLAQLGESTLSADIMLGTPQYISPEQARGDQNIDHHTDLYSFAIILYELLVGRVPFSSDSAYATVHEQIYMDPPLPSQFDPEITPAVESVLLKALSKDPQQRYHSARELMQALEDALNASGLRVLDPNRVRNAVPVGDSTQGAVPTQAGKAPAASERPVKDRPSFEENPGRYIGQMVRQSVHTLDEALTEIFSDEDERKSRDGSSLSSTSRLELTEAEERKIRKRIEKQIEERNGLWGHFAAYVGVNLFLFINNDLTPVWPVLIFWGMGMFAHFADYYEKYGAGRKRREAEIQREIERERERRYAGKVKNEELVETDTDEYRRVRLTGDGELTDSFVEEINQPKQKRR